MNVGYPSSNLSLDCRTQRSFRLASWTPERLIETVEGNLACLLETLRWNVDQGIGFFRISSTTIPFASHPVMTVDWRREFAGPLAEIGAYITAHGIRIGTHPGQFVLLNSPKEDVVTASVAELTYHADLFDLMGLDHTAKIQIHTGGVYGDKPAAIDAFVARHATLPDAIRRRLVIENDERLYDLADTLAIHARTGVPVVLDTLHHALHNRGESLAEALDAFIPTWDGHGAPMLDYSTQHPEKQAGAHTTSIDLADFDTVLATIGDRDLDIMLEIKDKEASALAALGRIAARAAA